MSASEPGLLSVVWPIKNFVSELIITGLGEFPTRTVIVSLSTFPTFPCILVVFCDSILFFPWAKLLVANAEPASKARDNPAQMANFIRIRTSSFLDLVLQFNEL